MNCKGPWGATTKKIFLLFLSNFKVFNCKFRFCFHDCMTPTCNEHKILQPSATISTRQTLKHYYLFTHHTSQTHSTMPITNAKYKQTNYNIRYSMIHTADVFDTSVVDWSWFPSDEPEDELSATYRSHQQHSQKTAIKPSVVNDRNNCWLGCRFSAGGHSLTCVQSVVDKWSLYMYTVRYGSAN